MSEKRVVIIGAGFTGLAAGCYARMNGYEVDIFEQHTVAGGLCTAWKRQGYTFDGCIHWLVGSDAGSGFSRIWREVGVLKDQTFLDPEIFCMCEGKDGQRLTLYTDPERLRAEMKRLSPEDARVIDGLCDAIQAFRRHGRALTDEGDRASWTRKLTGLLGMAKLMPLFFKWGRRSVQDFAQRLKSPFLSWGFRAPWDLPDFTMAAPLFTLAWMADRNAGYPIGGSLRLAASLEKRARELGCRLHLGRRVDKVLVEGDRAVGLRLAGGEEHRADYVIAAGDLHTLLFDLLAGKYGREHQAYFDRLPIFEPLMIVSYGVRRDFADLPPIVSSVNIQLPEPVELAGTPTDVLHCRVFNFDPTLAPEGSTVLQVYLSPRYEDWKELAKDRARYVAEKKAVADKILVLLESRFPGISRQIEVVDVATPTTFERYTSNWRGSYEGWMLTPKSMTMRMKRTLKGLDGLYLAGQWLQPGGGLPTAISHGRSAIQTLCARDGKDFVTTEA